MQEIAKFEKSFKDPKFMELLADYAKDMADPEVVVAQVVYPLSTCMALPVAQQRSLS